jgi:hypothetical protein
MPALESVRPSAHAAAGASFFLIRIDALLGGRLENFAEELPAAVQDVAFEGVQDRTAAGFLGQLVAFGEEVSRSLPGDVLGLILALERESRHRQGPPWARTRLYPKPLPKSSGRPDFWS